MEHAPESSLTRGGHNQPDQDNRAQGNARLVCSEGRKCRPRCTSRGWPVWLAIIYIAASSSRSSLHSATQRSWTHKKSLATMPSAETRLCREQKIQNIRTARDMSVRTHAKLNMIMAWGWDNPCKHTMPSLHLLLPAKQYLPLGGTYQGPGSRHPR